MMTARILEGREIERVKAFYKMSGYSQTPDPDDTILVAEDGDEIVAALRLCHEHGELVLRGMRVHSDKFRRGIGSELLRFAASVIGDGRCYCIAFTHLNEYYGRIGFEEITDDRAPAFLVERYRKHKFDLKMDVIMMERAAP